MIILDCRSAPSKTWGLCRSKMNRPLFAATLALNYRMHGLDVFGYHLVNVAIHIAAALTLFGTVRRSCCRGSRDASPTPPLARPGRRIMVDGASPPHASRHVHHPAL